MVAAINIRNRHVSNSSSLTSIATRISTKVNTKVRSLVTKFEFLGRREVEAGKIQSPNQHLLSKQRRSTVASIKQTPPRDSIPQTPYASPTVDKEDSKGFPAPAEVTHHSNAEKDEEDFPMRAEIVHVFSNVQVPNQPKRSAVQRCASMFDRLAKDRTVAFEGRVSQVHSYVPCFVEQKQSLRRLEKPKAVAKGKGGMFGGVKALIKVFNRQQQSKDKSAGKRSARRQNNGNGDVRYKNFDSSSSIASTQDEYYTVSRSDSTSSLAARRRSANQSHLHHESHSCSRQDPFAYLSKAPAPYAGRLPVVTVRGVYTPNTNGERKSSLFPVPKPKGRKVSTQSLASMLVRVRSKHILTPIENQNSQDRAHCTKCKPDQYWSCPSAGPSNPASPAASTNASSYELPALQVRRISFGELSFKNLSFGELSFGGQATTSTNPSSSSPSSSSSSSSSSSPALTPTSIHPRRKGTPLPESYLAARRNSKERFDRQLEAVRAEYPKEDLTDWQAALKIVTESDDSFYDESSDEVESVKDKQDAGQSGDKNGKGRTTSADKRDCGDEVLPAIPSSFSSPPLSSSRRSRDPGGSQGCDVSLSLLHPHHEPLASLTPDDNGSDKFHSLPATAGCCEPAEETCGDMPLGEIVQLLGRRGSLDQNTRVRIPVRGLPPGEVESPRPHMYRGATRNIRRLIGRWS